MSSVAKLKIKKTDSNTKVEVEPAQNAQMPTSPCRRSNRVRQQQQKSPVILTKNPLPRRRKTSDSAKGQDVKLTAKTNNKKAEVQTPQPARNQAQLSKSIDNGISKSISSESSLSNFRIPKRKVFDLEPKKPTEIIANKNKQKHVLCEPKPCPRRNNKIKENAVTVPHIVSSVPVLCKTKDNDKKSSKSLNKTPVVSLPNQQSPNQSLNSSNSIRRIDPVQSNSRSHHLAESSVSEQPSIFETSNFQETSSPHLHDLPDYEETEEVMEWENLFPEILKIVKEGSSPIKNHIVESDYNDDVDKMDVDVDSTEQLILVPDTNIWIGEMNLLKVLLEKKFSRVSYPIIVLPWMVLQELDVKVHSKTSQSENTRTPINFIYSLLKSKHPRLKGQKASDAAISKLKFDELVADDSILNCVFQNQNANNIVVFLSNDKNLLNKALIHGVHACDSESALSYIYEILGENASLPTSPLIKPNSSLLNHSQKIPIPSSLKRKLQQPTSFRSNTNSNICVDMDVEMDDGEEDTGQPATKVHIMEKTLVRDTTTQSNEIFQTLLNAFSWIIQWKMIEDYGLNGWEYALKIKPPWNLKTSIKCMISHWIANFSYVFSNRGETHLRKLLELVISHESVNLELKTELENQIVECALALFNLLDKEILNEPQVGICRQRLTDYAITIQQSI